MGPVNIRALDVDTLAQFYQERLGLRAIARSGDIITLGTDAPILVLEHAPDAPARPEGAAGLFHVAILYPTRSALAGAVRQLIETRTPSDGASDHLVSEAIYLTDPEGNGLEIYRDRPREAWPRLDGKISMATEPLDAQDLLAQATGPAARAPDGTHVGHVHVQVHDVDAADAFYHDIVGLDRVLRYGPSATFLSAGGYHHHIAANNWGIRAPTKTGALGMAALTIEVPGLDEARVLHDPAGNEVRIAPVET